MKAERIVFDTNVLISASLLPAGLPRRAVEALREHGGSLAFSDETFGELRSRLQRSKFDKYVSKIRRQLFLAQLEAVSVWVAIEGKEMGCRDADDDKLLETALTGNADCIVTGDQDLLVMGPFRSIPIVEPRQFLALINEG
ncbi:MAG: putative toxin-antitoxin system toxin component, PIN family [Pseudomonadota bacterium]